MVTADAGRCCHNDFEVIVRTLPRRFVPQHPTSFPSPYREEITCSS